MTRTDLIRSVADRHGLSRSAATVAVDAVLDGLVEALCAGQRVEIRGFGTWRARHYPGYIGRNPRTGERVHVPPKVLPVFRPGRALLARIRRTATEEA